MALAPDEMGGVEQSTLAAIEMIAQSWAGDKRDVDGASAPIRLPSQ
jgi:hypothetical protein